MSKWFDKREDERGVTMIVVIIIGMVVMVMATTIFAEVNSELGATAREARKNKANQAAEAGIDDYVAKLTEDHLYYTHFVHPAEDARKSSGGVTIATGAAWPYDLTWTYPVTKSAWRDLGNGYEYNLRITPPSASQIGIRIVATGRKAGSTKEYRSIEELIRPASVADFQMLANADISYGATATTYGKIYAGIDSGGTKHNIDHAGNAYGDLYAENTITGSPTYHDGAQGYTKTNIRTKIKNPVNFNTFTTSLSDIQSAANVAGILLNNSTAHAWTLQFKNDGTVAISKCTRSGSNPVERTAPTCAAATNYTVPSNGAIYSAQDVIVKGVVKGRVTIAAAGNIVISDNITYNTGGVDVLGLIASNEVIVAKWCPNNLTWYSASIAQSGQWRSYEGTTSKGTLNYYGSTATNDGGYMSMFATRNYNYDQNLAFLQPPYFPILEDAYTVLSYRDVTATS